jgi:3'-phosphoadenosine 5'-phosphosulfate (PAPS) 3'-phosphatase
MVNNNAQTLIELSNSNDSVQEEDRIYLPELTEILGRNQRTIRNWIRDSERFIGTDDSKQFLPYHLWPNREGGRQRLYWTPDQIDGLKEFANLKNKLRGWPAVK